MIDLKEIKEEILGTIYFNKNKLVEVCDRAITAEKALKVLADRLFDEQNLHIHPPWYEYERTTATDNFIAEALEKAREQG